jgi:hypothetical protein
MDQEAQRAGFNRTAATERSAAGSFWLGSCVIGLAHRQAVTDRLGY